MTVTLACIADLHIGGTTSLCKPVVNLDDGGTYHASEHQRFIWRSWNNFLEQAEKRKAGNLLTLINGDLPEGDYKSRSAQVITRNKATISGMCAETITPLASMSDQGVIFVRGTEAHAGPSAELEEEIAKDTDNAIPCPETDKYSWWTVSLTIERVPILAYHHPGGNGGGRPMNAFSSIDRLAADTLFNFANAGKEPPRLVICSHIHQYKDSYDHFRVRALTLPCWTFKNAYAHRLGLGATANTIGGALIHFGAGEYEVEPFIYVAKSSPFYSIGKLKHANDNR